MSIEKLENVEKYFRKSNIQYEESCYALQFMQETIITFKDQQAQIAELRGKVKTLEQAKTFFPMTEGKHRALLNNCVDNDEAILREREIKEVKG